MKIIRVSLSCFIFHSLGLATKYDGCNRCIKRNVNKFRCTGRLFTGFTLMLTMLMLTSSYKDPSPKKALPHYPDSLFSTYYHQRLTLFKSLPLPQNSIVFLGNSITDGGEWAELFDDPRIINRGINGDITTGVLNRLGDVVKDKPQKIFLLIGINDLARGAATETVYENILLIVSLIQEYSPATKIYVQGIFPVNKSFSEFPRHANKGEQVNDLNQKLKRGAARNNYIFVDVNKSLSDRKGMLDAEYTNDGLHLLGTGYLKWKHAIYPHLYDLQQKPSVVPLPQSLKWNDSVFPLYRCEEIAVSHDSLTNVAKTLQDILKTKGISAGIHSATPASSPAISLRIGKVDAHLNKEEAYTLDVDNDRIVVTGNTAHGIFNGIQTLRQLMRDGTFVDGCNILDWPAFSWRGYMVDVGRNYQSIQQLKEQIDIMAQYKLSIFHFHLTENVAWRLQIRQYPQLTSAKTMTRNQGEYYTIEGMKGLVDYCKERFITMVPEIDMPGHGDAFKRAMGMDMQSDSGLTIVKNILREVDSTYKDIPYFHIGADEVTITNENFIPEVTGLLHERGKQTIGWKPGGNYGEKTIRQLWNWQNPRPNIPGVYYVDSRNLYLDGIDAFSGVIQIFNKEICDVKEGNDYLLGGEICAWHDSRVKDEKDFLLTNPIYPSMVAFAERSWCGGGYETKLSAFKTDKSERFKDFTAFENRLLDQKKLFFQNKPFAYVRQTDIQWNLFGPFDNKGDTSVEFWPEKNLDSLGRSSPDRVVYGGTILLNKFLDANIKDSLKLQKPYTTWYAYRKIYSPVDTMASFWINFNDVGRSLNIATPLIGNWDRKGGKVWINGKAVPPPHWTYPGRRGEQETPLVDEGYAYRPPSRIPLKKGWNTILVKAPIGRSYRWDWLDPVKWMFTVVEIKND